ncbi:BKACE family enzyme [Capillimicrobium parvum]|uniref:3-keto-5-aminohexanoate cleavage enzyme n=1 Tax=Capillimicrobium parvum TaxID=2884022 RepID=A0A9E6XXC5_9ACTN|nr:3-keto-5-aminohexanoate cleavage protein [Capillimicrobium parvum]UGS36154.1 3-keto-5-aminohexanoate cleavage enzyme [Capillimicrobium parvum]
MVADAPPIITCALTGGYHDKATTPALPEQPEEIVEQGIAAWAAGAAVLHVHARDPDGRNTTDREIYREIHTRLCTETDAIVQLTTGGGLSQTYEQRLSTALLSPEMCSLNMGHVLFFTRDGRALMLDNPRAQIEWFAREMLDRGVKPELEVYNPTMLEEVERLVDAGLLQPPLNVGFVLGAPGQSAARGTWQNLCHAVSRLPAGANCSVIGIGRAQLPLTTMGLAMGLNIRVGLEDNVRYSRTEMARDNAQLVERAVRIARELQLRPATPSEAREILGTRGRSAGAVPEPLVADERPRNDPPLTAAAAGDEFSTV